MQACAREGKRVVVLDRPNPLGGEVVDGNVLDPEYRSFVGLHPLAVRHGLTVGELALMFRQELGLHLDLTVVEMKGWRRSMAYEDTGLPWVLPSPNMPTVDTAFVYPGGCLVEGTNLSEGRGTTRPFELVGAPWLDGGALAARARARAAPGRRLPRRPRSRPRSRSTRAQPCHGVQVHVTDRRRFPAFLAYLLLIHHARRQDPEHFAWRDPPYEYEQREAAVRHPVRDGPHPPGDRVRRLAEAAGRGLGQAGRRLPPTPRELPALLIQPTARVPCSDSSRAVPDQAVARGRSVVSTTESTISAPPPSSPGVSGSRSTSQPSRTATIGFTYAYVPTVLAGSSFRQWANAVKPISEPNATR